jgi:hypothetical protein
MSLKVPAQWTDDCQGKKDFDGELVSLSTRYWPRGGGFYILDSRKPNATFEGNEARPHISPTANAAIYLGSTTNEFYDDAILLIEREFEAETQEEVQQQVEEWALVQYTRIARALSLEFGVGPLINRVRRPRRT